MLNLKNLIPMISIAIISLTITACNGEDVYPTDHNTPQTARKFHLTKESQRTLRYDCDKRLISDKMETISSPTKYIDIKPMSNKEITASSFFNNTTGQGPGSITGHVGVTIDMSSGYFNMQVKEGINEIKYSFQLCVSKDQNGLCIKTDTEQGYMYLDISYSSTNLEGYREVFRSEYDCPAQN